MMDRIEQERLWAQTKMDQLDPDAADENATAAGHIANYRKLLAAPTEAERYVNCFFCLIALGWTLQDDGYEDAFAAIGAVLDCLPGPDDAEATP